MDPTWPDCPHPQCDERNPPEALYCARCGRPQYQSPEWQDHAIAKATRANAEPVEGFQALMWIVAILFGFLVVATVSLFVRA